MALYTFLMEFRRGTYITQVYADTVKEACMNWIRVLDIKDIKHLTKKKKRKMEKELNEVSNLPIPITGINNVWCMDILSGKNFTLINIVKTIT